MASSSSLTVEDLDLFIGRLRQVKEWLVQDPQLLHLIDRHMSQHVRQMEQRQSLRDIWLSVITTVTEAILGWPPALHLQLLSGICSFTKERMHSASLKTASCLKL